MRDNAVGDILYVEITDIHRTIGYKKQGPYRITEIFTNDTILFQRRQVNKRINIRRLMHHFFEYTNPFYLGTLMIRYIWVINVVSDFIFRIIFFFPFYFLVLEKKVFLSSFSYFCLQAYCALYRLNCFYKTSLTRMCINTGYTSKIYNSVICSPFPVYVNCRVPRYGKYNMLIALREPESEIYEIYWTRDLDIPNLKIGWEIDNLTQLLHDVDPCWRPGNSGNLDITSYSVTWTSQRFRGFNLWHSTF